MGYIRRPSNPGSGSTKDTDFIKFVHSREPQIHEVWSLGLDRIILKVPPTAQLEVPAGTIGDFLTDYLSENGNRIQIIRQLSINNAYNFWVLLPNPGDVDCRFFATCKLPLIPQGG